MSTTEKPIEFTRDDPSPLFAEDVKTGRRVRLLCAPSPRVGQLVADPYNSGLSTIRFVLFDGTSPGIPSPEAFYLHAVSVETWSEAGIIAAPPEPACPCDQSPPCGDCEPESVELEILTSPLLDEIDAEFRVYAERTGQPALNFRVYIDGEVKISGQPKKSREFFLAWLREQNTPKPTVEEDVATLRMMIPLPLGGTAEMPPNELQTIWACLDRLQSVIGGEE